MFFFLSKILAFFFSPFNWLILLVFAFLLIKKTAKRNKIKIAFLAIFLFFSYQPIVLLFISGWETEGKTFEQVKHHKVGVVLGGGFEYDSDRERLSIRRGGDRLWCALQLYHLGKIDYVLLSGKSGSLMETGLDESNQLKAILIQNGIPEEHIWVDSESMNTYQNAVESKKILDEKGVDDVLLITSALHMRRARGVFAKQGIEVGEFATDFYGGPSNWTQFIFPTFYSFMFWDNYLHEVFGYTVYAITGKL